MKNIEELIEWMTLNPELAEKEYPELVHGLIKRIKSSEPFYTALIIQKLPSHFPKWKGEVQQHLGITRKKMIYGYISVIKTVLVEYENPSEIEQQAIESVRAELTEQLEYWNNELNSQPDQRAETRTDKLRAELNRYGFRELSKVKEVSELNKEALIEQISDRDLPYGIAMLDFLGFVEHLKTEHFKTDYKLFSELAKWFGVNERAVKGNINVLKEYSKENRTRYTAYQQKKTVQMDYEKLI